MIGCDIMYSCSRHFNNYNYSPSGSQPSCPWLLDQLLFTNKLRKDIIMFHNKNRIYSQVYFLFLHYLLFYISQAFVVKAMLKKKQNVHWFTIQVVNTIIVGMVILITRIAGHVVLLAVKNKGIIPKLNYAWESHLNLGIIRD